MRPARCRVDLLRFIPDNDDGGVRGARLLADAQHETMLGCRREGDPKDSGDERRNRRKTGNRPHRRLGRADPEFERPVVSSPGVERKLTAILYADVAGYSRLTGEDEEGTYQTLRQYLDAISRVVKEAGGRVVHYAGDAVLAEFSSVVAAVTCAVDVQGDLAARNESLSEARRIRFRIGINLGDVIVDREVQPGQQRWALTAGLVLGAVVAGLAVWLLVQPSSPEQPLNRLVIRPSAVLAITPG